MTNWDHSDEQGVSVCSNAEDLKYAEKICKQIGIPLVEVRTDMLVYLLPVADKFYIDDMYYQENFTKDYWINVFEPFLRGYSMVCSTRMT